jgi:hypothetical protein
MLIGGLYGMPLTETQKNFRKKMKDLEKENKHKKIDGVSQPYYSYYERDVINNYYDKKRTKKRIFQGISLVSIMFILWNSYAILT